MKIKFLILILIIFVLLGNHQLNAADEINLRFVVVNNDGSDFDVKVQCNRNNSSWDKLGSSNFYFDFNTSGLSNPSEQTAHNFTTATNSFYDDLTIGYPGSGARVSINIIFNGSNGQGTDVPTSGWTDIVTIDFDVIDSGQSSNLTWVTSTPPYAAYDDDESTFLDPGSFNNLDSSLPVQMSRLSAEITREKGVTIYWRTESEVNTTGFDIYRSETNEGNYQKINPAIIPGQGNGSSGYEYSYSDKTVKDGIVYWYKVVEIALDKTMQEYGPIRAEGINTVPDEFTLSPNYPNPFNPTTNFKYQLAEDAEVTINVYNLMGEKVKQLVKENQPAGYYDETWTGVDGSGRTVSSGIYFIYMQAGSFSQTRKITLIR
ncbi:MAG: FlgD immunoglobulin-like domain containing protein [bacterium]